MTDKRTEKRTETHACDLIDRQDAIDAICKACFLVGDYHKCYGYPETSAWCDKLVALRALPVAQPDVQKMQDLEQAEIQKAYELGKLDAMDEMPHWIPFETRPLTEEEKEEHPEWDCILDCKLPDDGQRILVAIRIRGHEEVQQDEFYSDDGSYLDSGYEIGTEAIAWMPLPEPYREGEQNDK